MSQVKNEFSHIFTDAFEAGNNDIGVNHHPVASTYDVSKGQLYDAVLNGEAPSPEDIKLRIVRYLNEGGDVSKLLATSEMESHDDLRERWVNGPDHEGTASFCMAPYRSWTSLEYLTPVEFNKITQMVRWQVMRNELLEERSFLQNHCKLVKATLRDGSVIRIPESGQYPGISYNSWREARSKVVSFLKLENAYILEMLRLYSMTGVEKLKFHVVQTTPVIQALLFKFHCTKTSAWGNVRGNYGRMLHAEAAADESGRLVAAEGEGAAASAAEDEAVSPRRPTTDFGPIGGPVLKGKAGPAPVAQ